MQSVTDTIFGRKSLAAKTQLVSFGSCDSSLIPRLIPFGTGTIGVKMDRYVLKQRSFL